MARAAIAARDPGPLQGCAQIEALVHGRAFAGAMQMILAWMLAGLAGRRRAADQRAEVPGRPGGPGRKDTVLVQFTTALASIPVDSALASQLRHILGLPDGP